LYIFENADNVNDCQMNYNATDALVPVERSDRRENKEHQTDKR